MFVESQAIITTMQYLKTAHGMPSYPVHDSLIVPAPRARLAASLLAIHYQVHVGVFPRLDTKSTLPGAREAVQQGVEEARPVRARATAAALEL
jgi:hypothetical protein